MNPDIVSKVEQAGLYFTGKDESGQRMEFMELPTSVHPYYLGCQAHPEFQSYPRDPSPPFLGLVHAAAKTLDTYLGNLKPDLERGVFDSIDTSQTLEENKKLLYPSPRRSPAKNNFNQFDSLNLNGVNTVSASSSENNTSCNDGKEEKESIGKKRAL